MPKYKLTYFSARARAELCRYLLHAAQVSFEDVYIKGGSTWEEAKKRAPFGQCPFLEIDDGRILAQSLTIARYLARELNLAGMTSWETAIIDQYTELSQEILNSFLRLTFYDAHDEEQKKAGLKTFLEEIAPKYLKMFENILVKGGGKYFVGNSLTMADLAVLDSFDNAVQKDPQIMDSYPRLAEHRKVVTELPGIKSYLKKRIKVDL